MRCLEVTGPICPLCGEGAVFALKNKSGHPLRVRWLGGGGEEDSGKGGDETSAHRCASARTAHLECEHAVDAGLEPVPEAQQDAPTGALARCTVDARDVVLMRAQIEAPVADGVGAVEVRAAEGRALPPRPRPTVQTTWAASAAADHRSPPQRYAIS